MHITNNYDLIQNTILPLGKLKPFNGKGCGRPALVSYMTLKPVSKNWTMSLIVAYNEKSNQQVSELCNGHARLTHGYLISRNAELPYL